MYKSEAAFSKAFCAALKKAGWVVQRIESGETGCGIPDIWCAKNGYQTFIELKNQPYLTGTSFPVKIMWRKGQQAWALQYFKTVRRPMFTVVALQKSFMFIPVIRRYNENSVYREDVMQFAKLSDVVAFLER